PPPGNYSGVPASILSEQPVVNVVRDGLQTRVADRLAVDAGHMGYLMTHNVVGGGLVLRLVGHRAEGMPERVEAESLAAVGAELVEQLRELVCDRTVSNRAFVRVPRRAVLRDEDQPSVDRVFWFGSPGDGRSQGGHRFSPERTAARNAS